MQAIKLSMDIVPARSRRPLPAAARAAAARAGGGTVREATEKALAAGLG